MKLANRTKIIFLLIGDVIALYLSLLVTLALRHGQGFYSQFLDYHLFPFSVIFPLWLIVFYVAGLYELSRLRNNLDFIKTLALTLGVNALLTIAIFYLIPAFGITPKRNLFIFIAVFSIIEIWWRRTFNVRASFRQGLNRVLMLGEGKIAEEIYANLKDNPQHGYEIKVWLKGGLSDPHAKNLESVIREHGINMIVVPRAVKTDIELSKTFYKLLTLGIEVRDLPNFYETVFRKVPIVEVGEDWFLEHHIGQRKFYDDLKRGLELIFALFLQIILLPLEAVIAFVITLNSPGPAVCTQIRMGRFGKPYRHYKFRTMQSCMEKNGPRWTATLSDPRITAAGRFLRYTHLDELPQLVNILRGELSFVGPRPERPEFVTILEKEIPFYETRHLVKPGVTGWAQVNFRYGASREDAHEKLQYDIYYLKNRSLILDIAIILKTLRTLFINQK